jgi:sugar O-acyltransferase (sialic acid O-acetyltransferase NeuD family)
MKKALIGAGGLAGEMTALLGTKLPCFIEDTYLPLAKGKVLPLSSFDPSAYQVCIAIANPLVRARIAANLPQSTTFFTYVHPTALFHGERKAIGEGTFIGCYAVVMNDVVIGKHCLLNRNNQIGHNSALGDFFTGLPSAIISGNVTIGKRVIMGAGAMVLENLRVCDDVTIGAMTCVTKDLINMGVYVGTPARLKESL